MILVILLIPTSVIVLFVIGMFFDPTRNIYTMVSSVFWTIYGPTLIVFARVAAAIGAAIHRVRPDKLPITLVLVSMIAALSTIVIDTTIENAARRAGGHASLITGLRLSSMSAAPPDEVVTYANREGHILRALVYKPANRPSVKPLEKENTLAPVLLYVHGGGWISGTSDANAADLRWSANHGWLAISIDYRLATSSEATWDEAPDDVACALIWTKGHSEQHRGDPNRIVLIGESAGGNLAINVAYSAALHEAHSSCGHDVPIPIAVIADYPVVDPQEACEDGVRIFGHGPRDFTSKYVGGDPQNFPDRMRAISSATYLSLRAPAALIFEPEKDGFIPTPGVYRFVDQARHAGVDITMIRIPFSNHGFNLGAPNSIGDQAQRTIAESFFERRGVIGSQR